MKTWANQYYSHTFKGPGLVVASAPVTTGIDSFLADASAISGLANAFIAILTPIATYAANKYDADERNAAVDKFLSDSKNYAPLILMANGLAKPAAVLAQKSKYQALGQFSEKLAALRQSKVDLSKLKVGDDKSCIDVVKSSAGESEQFGVETSAATAPGDPKLHFAGVPSWITAEMKVYADNVPTDAKVLSVDSKTGTVTMSADSGAAGVPKGATVRFTFFTATDNFISCVAQGWKQVSSAASDAVTAATAYDTIADIPGDQLTNAVAGIEKDVKQKLPWPASKAPASAQAAAQLVAFGQAMASAFSSDNLQKVQTELDLVKTKFDIK
jgi:hypothetical protein